MSSVEVKPEQSVARCTVRLECGVKGHPASSYGTGFFYNVADKHDRRSIYILTNRHVVNRNDYVEFVISGAKSASDFTQRGQPINRVDLKHHVDLYDTTNTIHDSLILHPDPNIDLCAINITNIISSRLAQHNLRIQFLDNSWLATSKDKMCDVEQIISAGYPASLWDEYNNMPIARVGFTSTNPSAYYQGKKDFVMDMAIIEGASGSPVFHYQRKIYENEEGGSSFGTKTTLIGVVWGCITRTDRNEVKIINIPTSSKPVVDSKYPMNLGLALHADLILDIEKIILERMYKIELA